MYKKGTLHCLSFSMKKNLSIGEAGMILTDDKKAYEWLKLARFDGRHEGVPLSEDNLTVVGWNMYMTPDRAARGLWVFDMLKNKEIPDMDSTKQGYPDLSTFPIYQ
jgi:dTDP-4-amino-4,6-dideoxygalactose transaminase